MDGWDPIDDSPLPTDALAMNESTPQVREKGAGERARELAAIHEAIERGWSKWEAAGGCDPSCGCATVWIEREIEPVLAGALAAVRLEEREACIQDIQDAVGDWGGPEREHYTQAMQRATDAIKKREQGLDLWGRPLAERAVEDK